MLEAFIAWLTSVDPVYFASTISATDLDALVRFTHWAFNVIGLVATTPPTP